jgi:recombination protein RecA
VGNRTRVKVVKNKLAPPFRQAEFDILYGEGINQAGDVLDLAVAGGIVGRNGSWYTFGDERLGQGRENVCAILRDRPEVMEAIRAKVIASPVSLSSAEAA